MSRTIQVKDLRPGDLVINDNGKEVYIKNIYDSNGAITPIVEQVYGHCVVLEYTDDKSKCNQNYTDPVSGSVDSMDYSVQTPSIFPINDYVTIKTL